MIQTLTRKGGSYYLRITPQIIREMGITDEDQLQVEVVDGRIQVMLVRTIPKITPQHAALVDEQFEKYEEAFRAWAK